MGAIKNRNTLVTLFAVAFLMLCAAYGSVPLYRIFCQKTGYGGTTQIAARPSKIIGSREIVIHFNADVNKELLWDFKPLQKQIKIKVGQNALAFYRVHNRSDEAQMGMAIYNVVPDKAGVYFNKVHCFCFDEQTVNAGETIDMPVFFFIDPEMEKDPNLDDVKVITLSYTFFKL